MNCEKIGNFIMQNRKAKKLTQKQLAEKLNITDRAVSRWERGVGAPDISLLIPLGEILEVSVNEILSGEKIDNITKEQLDKILVNSISLYKKSERKKALKSLFLIITMIFFFIIAIGLFNISMIISNLSIYYIFLIFLSLFISLLIFTKLNKDYLLKKKIVIITCIIYTISLLIYTFYTGITYKINGVSQFEFSYNLIPFKKIFEAFNLVFYGVQPLGFLFDYIIIDLCIFIPYSFFIPYLNEKITFAKFTIIMSTIIVAKEVFQGITGWGIFDINDIILNLIGVLLMFNILKYFKLNIN